MPDLSGFFYLFLLLVLFVVPLVLMIGLYSAVTYTLWMGIKLDSTPPANGEMSKWPNRKGRGTEGTEGTKKIVNLF